MKHIYLKTFFTLLCGLLPIIANADTSDAYEPDNTIENATVLLLNKGDAQFPKPDYETIQNHNFYDENDIDWYQFYAAKGITYVLEIKSVGIACDPVIEIFDSDGTNLNADVLSQPIDINFNGEGEYAEWQCTKSDIYYARIRQCDNDIEGCTVTYGDHTQYQIVLYLPILQTDCLLYGTIQPSTKAIVKLDNAIGTLSLPNGQFYLPANSGTYTLQLEATEFLPYTQTIILNALKSISVTITLNDNSVQVIDMFEPDDTFDMARVIDLTHEKHAHTFYPPGDSDISIFYAIADQSYTITMQPSDDQLDVAFYIFETSDNNPHVRVDNAFAGESEQFVWTCPAQGLYHLSAFQSNETIPQDPSYTLSIGTVHPTVGIIHGKVVDQQTQEALSQVLIHTMTGETALSHPDGSFHLLYQGELPIRIISNKSGYIKEVSIKENSLTGLTIEMQKQSSQPERNYVLEQMWPISVHPRSYPYHCDFEFYEWQMDTAQYENQYWFRIDPENNRIQKFNMHFQLLKQWGKEGAGPGEFDKPQGLAVSGNSLFVCDTNNYRIQQFDLNGMYINEWGVFGSGQGEFNLPTGIAVDDNNLIYVADTDNHRIQIFTTEGVFWDQFGELGALPGQMRKPTSIFVMDNYIHVSEKNGRIQVFRPVDQLPRHRAIIVSADQISYPASFRKAIQTHVHFAYRTLMAQGLTKSRIEILSNDTYDDMDCNTIKDDSTQEPSLDTLQSAILDSDLETETLLIYLTGLSGNGQFQLSDSEILMPEKLDAWLDEYKQITDCKIILVMDCNDAQTFMMSLTPANEDKFVRIASTASNENAAFLDNGLISFSSYFWTEIMDGQNILDAFAQSKHAMTLTTLQTPQLIYSEPQTLTSWTIGNGTSFGISPPEIQHTEQAHTYGYSQGVHLKLDAVSDIDDMASAFAVILPPDVKEKNVSLFDLPVKTLTQESSQSYQANYTSFYAQGKHTMLFYAMDKTGTLSLPVLESFTYTGTTPYKAMILLEKTDATTLCQTFQATASRIYTILTHQGYSDSDILLFSPEKFSDIVDQKSSRMAIFDAIYDLKQKNLTELLICFIGERCSPFYLNDVEVVYSDELHNSLNELQRRTSCHITLIFDAGNANSIYETFQPDEPYHRTIIGSTGKNESPLFLPDSHLSFSYLFWQEVQSGSLLWDAFVSASKVMNIFDIHPGLDANGDGESSEYEYSFFYYLYPSFEEEVYPDCNCKCPDPDDWFHFILDPIIIPFPIHYDTDPTDKNIVNQRKLIHHPIEVNAPVIDDPSLFDDFFGRYPIIGFFDNSSFSISLSDRTWFNLEVNTIRSFNPIAQVFAVVYEGNEQFREYPLIYQQGTHYQRKLWCTNVGQRYIQMFARDDQGNISNSKFIIVRKTHLPVSGDINGNQMLDLRDVIMGLQILNNIPLDDFRDDYLNIDPSYDGVLGMDDILYIFWEIASM
jgi:hypothetical protein